MSKKYKMINVVKGLVQRQAHAMAMNPDDLQSSAFAPTRKTSINDNNKRKRLPTGQSPVKSHGSTEKQHGKENRCLFCS